MVIDSVARISDNNDENKKEQHQQTLKKIYPSAAIISDIGIVAATSNVKSQQKYIAIICIHTLCTKCLWVPQLLLCSQLESGR